MPNPQVILVIDDDSAIREVLRLALESDGYTVVAASGGAEALEVLTTLRPHLVLLDLMMPGVDGWQVQQFLQEQLPTIPLVVMSASARVQARIERFRSAGYLPKPFELEDLLTLVRRLALPA